MGPILPLPGSNTPAKVLKHPFSVFRISLLYVRDGLIGSKNKAENETGFPLCGVGTHTMLWLLSETRSAQQERRKRAFRT